MKPSRNMTIGKSWWKATAMSAELPNTASVLAKRAAAVRQYYMSLGLAGTQNRHHTLR